MKQVLLLIVLFPFVVAAQSLSIGEITNKSVTYSILDQEYGKCYVFFSDSLSVIDLDLWKEIRRTALPYPTPDFTSEYRPLVIKDSLWFIHRKGGLVYQFDHTQFVRKDHSFDHRMQVKSAIFAHRDTIYRYGGYGFWTYRNFFTYFDPGLEEWMAVAPRNSESFPKGTENSVVHTSARDFYVIGGISALPQNYEKRYFVNEVWKYDLYGKRWQFFGNVPGVLMEKDLHFSLGDRVVFSDQISPYLWVVDIANNRFRMYRKHSTYIPLAKRSTVPPMVYKNDIYTLVWGPNGGSRLEFVRLPEDQVLGELIEEYPLLRDFRIYYWIIGTIIFIGLSGILIVRLKKQWIREHRVVFRKDNFYYKGRALDLDAKEIKILYLLLTQKGEVVTRDILDITENKELHYAHNIKVKNHLIDQLNFKLKSVLGIEENLISIEKSETDRRIKVYRVQKDKFIIS